MQSLQSNLDPHAASRCSFAAGQKVSSGVQSSWVLPGSLVLCDVPLSSEEVPRILKEDFDFEERKRDFDFDFEVAETPSRKEKPSVNILFA